MATVAPRLTDLVMEAAGASIQQKLDDPGDPARRDNLCEFRADGTTRGSQRVHARSMSLLVQAQKLPGGLMSVAVMGVGITVAVARRLRGRRRTG
jgi:hypothetical protein